VTPAATLYLAKSRESLASAQADFEGGRHNSSTNRAYYAAFQAAVALLIENDVRPHGGSWDHKFVMSQFSGTLVQRMKIIPSEHRGVLERLLESRVRADYRAESISRSDARRLVREASALVREAGRALEGT
jgi:uncharacterized protein (UPF0332 family)